MNNLLTLIPYASYKYHVMAMGEGEREGVVYSRAPCDRPMSILKSPSRGNKVKTCSA